MEETNSTEDGAAGSTLRKRPSADDSQQLQLPFCHTFMITRANPYGAPTRAECSCGWQWYQPNYDWWSDTLAVAVIRHIRAEGGLAQITYRSNAD